MMAQVKTIMTTLDSLPAGAGPEILENGKLKKVPLSQGVTRKMLLKDIILIAWPSLVELLLTQLTSMADQVMVGRLPGQEGIVAVYNSSPQVIAAGSGIMLLIAASQPLQATQFIVSGGLRGAGDTRYTAFVVMITTLVVRSILAVLLVTVLDWGLWGAWIALMLDQVLRTVLMVARYNTAKWVKIWGARKK